VKTRTVQIGDCAEVVNGFAFKSELFTEERRGLPIIRIRDVLRGRSETFYTGEYPENSVIQNGDLLVGMDGEFNIARWQGGKALLNQRVCKIHAKQGVADGTYLLHALPIALKRIEDRTPYVTVKHLSSEELKEEIIPLPELSEQQRIAGRLEAADGLRRTRRYALELSANFLPAAFLQLFGDPKQNPKGFPFEYLCDVSDPKQWPTISGNQILDRGFPVYGANGQIGFFSDYNHEHPTVLITCRGATCGTINVCPPKSYVTGNAMSLDNPDVSKLTIEYLEWSLRLRGLNDAITGSAQPQITRQSLEPVGIPVPPPALQQQFTGLVARVERLRAVQRESLRQAEHLFQSLLHEAFAA
jgi:type I restriction enzyme, S subunit